MASPSLTSAAGTLTSLTACQQILKHFQQKSYSKQADGGPVVQCRHHCRQYGPIRLICAAGRGRGCCSHTLLEGTLMRMFLRTDSDVIVVIGHDWKWVHALCRAGELLFTLAKAFPNGRYHGYDISAHSLDAANKRWACHRSQCMSLLRSPTWL